MGIRSGIRKIDNELERPIDQETTPRHQTPVDKLTPKALAYPDVANTVSRSASDNTLCHSAGE